MLELLPGQELPLALTEPGDSRRHRDEPVALAMPEHWASALLEEEDRTPVSPAGAGR